ncbi:MAG: hypothetical protein WDN06_11200 [Asticcacaulis sp.]
MTRKKNAGTCNWKARAHIRLQRAIDQLHAEGRLPEPTSDDFIQWLHRSFYEDAPQEMLLIKGKDREILMRPGVYRERPEEDVDVGRHQPTSSERVSAFMDHFSQR